jgi:hypothetical protein
MAKRPVATVGMTGSGGLTALSRSEDRLRALGHAVDAPFLKRGFTKAMDIRGSHLVLELSLESNRKTKG